MMTDELQKLIGKTVQVFVKSSDRNFTYKGTLIDIKDNLVIINDFKTGKTIIPIVNILSIGEVG